MQLIPVPPVVARFCEATVYILTKMYLAFKGVAVIQVSLEFKNTLKKNPHDKAYLHLKCAESALEFVFFFFFLQVQRKDIA